MGRPPLASGALMGRRLCGSWAASPAAGSAHSSARRWAIQQEQYQGRVGSIPAVFDAAAADLGRPGVDAAVVEAVWRKLLPGGGRVGADGAGRSPPSSASSLRGAPR
jgi:hypothetical protein